MTDLHNELTADWIRATSESDLVYVIPHGFGERPLLHTDPDCHVLETAEAEASAKPRAVFPDRRVCQFCAGTAETGQKGGRRAPDRDAAVVDVLRDAGQPVTRADIALEGHLSDPATKRALRKLRDRGRVETAPVPEGRDGRKTYYRLTESEPDPESEADAARAQLTPVGLGVLTLVLGLVLLAGAVAIANGVIVG